MEAEKEIAPFVAYKDCVSCFWVCACGKFSQSVLKKLISVNF